MGVSAGGAYPRRIYSYVLWAYFDKLTFLGGPICGEAYLRGGVIMDFCGILATVFGLQLIGFFQTKLGE